MNHATLIRHWRDRTKPRASGHSMSFEGDTLRSYQRTIAKLHGTCVFLQDIQEPISLSRMTIRHAYDVLGIVLGRREIIYVAHPGAADHHQNFQGFHRRAKHLVEQIKSRRMQHTFLADRHQLDECFANARRYCELFGIPVPEDLQDAAAYLSTHLPERQLVRITQWRLAA